MKIANSRTATIIASGGLLGLALCATNVGAAALAFARPVCSNYGTGRCINIGTDPLILSARHAYNFQTDYVGTVSNKHASPFNPGSGYNKKYDGYNVVIFRDAAGASCIDSDPNWNLDTAHGRACTVSSDIRFVEYGGWLISVGATNYFHRHRPSAPYVVTAKCLRVGCKVLVAPGKSKPAAQQNWSFH